MPVLHLRTGIYATKAVVHQIINSNFMRIKIIRYCLFLMPTDSLLAEIWDDTKK